MTIHTLIHLADLVVGVFILYAIGEQVKEQLLLRRHRRAIRERLREIARR